MAAVATVIAFLAIAGAVVSWIAGAIFHARAAAEARPSLASLAGAALWPFAATQRAHASAADAARLNKALVAVIACVMVAVAATSAATNLHRLTK